MLGGLVSAPLPSPHGRLKFNAKNCITGTYCIVVWVYTIQSGPYISNNIHMSEYDIIQSLLFIIISHYLLNYCTHEYVSPGQTNELSICKCFLFSLLNS